MLEDIRSISLSHQTTVACRELFRGEITTLVTFCHCVQGMSHDTECLPHDYLHKSRDCRVIARQRKFK